MIPATPRLIAALEGRYTIERGLGQGGMATVYLARDVRHDRLVALKVLRPELAAVIGAERFLAEIKTTANLQHPHILPLHDSGEADGTVFYVMPYVEGESLRDRIQHEKQLPVDEAIRIAREVAGALDYAHRHGVVHRDIKPENILLHDGQALVADFGIALAVNRSEGGSRMTETGMSLGTPHYMAPEQAMGQREITAKADIYALGCVLYEMLTGDPPFTGSTAQAIVARAVTEHPRPIMIQRHTVPPHVEATTLKALEKLPADRFASAAEFAEALENPALTLREVASAAHGGATHGGAAHGGATHGAEWRARAAIPLGALAIVASTGLAWTLLRPAPSAPVSRYALDFPESEAPTVDRSVLVSPDGSHLLYVGPGDGDQTRLWLKARDRHRATPIAGTENVISFTFSPDGQSIAFLSPLGQVSKVPISGGAAIPLADSAQLTRGLAWLDDGTIVFPFAGATGIRRVPDVGGPTTVVWQRDSTASTTVFYPTALPGSRGVLFTRCEGGGSCVGGIDLWVSDLRSGEERLVVAGAVRGYPVPTGHLVYVRLDGGVLAVPFNARSLRTAGAAVPVRDSIALGVAGNPAFSVSTEGTLYTRTGGATTSLVPYELVWVDRSGVETPIDTTFVFRQISFGSNAGWALSPDGTRLAIGQNSQGSDHIWVKQLPRGPISRVTFDSNPSFRPRWTRDGRAVIYISTRAGNAKMYKRASDGTGEEQLIYGVRAAPGIFEGVWSLDEKTLVLRAGGTVSVVGDRDIYVARPEVDSTPTPLIASEKFDESAIAMSPDGRWLAYESNETGRKEVYVRPFPAVNAGKWQVSTEGGRAPLWAKSGRELFLVNAARELVVAPIAPGASLQIGDRKILFRLRADLYLAEQENYTPYDIAPDGRRFIMARRVRTTTTPTSPLIVTENWFEELRRIVGKP